MEILNLEYTTPCNTREKKDICNVRETYAYILWKVGTGIIQWHLEEDFPKQS
jgi:hypothetical protein